MKNRLSVLLLGVALAVVSGTAAAHGRVGVGISIGIPGPVFVAPPPVYYPVAPVYYAPPPYYGPSVYYAPPLWRFGPRVHGAYHRGWRGHR